MTFRRNYFRELFINLLWKSYLQCSDKKEKTRNTFVNVKRPLGTSEGHFELDDVYDAALAATMESLVTNVWYNVLIYYFSLLSLSVQKARTTFIELLL